MNRPIISGRARTPVTCRRDLPRRDAVCRRAIGLIPILVAFPEIALWLPSTRARLGII
jgi:hypothetical protein